jgi:predicted small metal-binding protein
MSRHAKIHCRFIGSWFADAVDVHWNWKGEAYMKPGMLCPYCRRHLKAKSYMELFEVVQKHAENKHAEEFEELVRAYCRDRDRFRFEGYFLRADVLASVVNPLPGSEESIYATALDETGQLLFRKPTLSKAGADAVSRGSLEVIAGWGYEEKDAASRRSFEKWAPTQEERYKLEVALSLVKRGYGYASWFMRFTQKYLGAIEAAAHMGELLDPVEIPTPSPEPPQAVHHVQPGVMPSDKKNTSK